MNEKMAAVLIWEHLEGSDDKSKDEIEIVLNDGRVITVKIEEVKKPLLKIVEND